MSDDRKISITRARITRPVAAEPTVEDDTDENEPVRPPSVQRVRTPADVTLEALLADLEGKGVPPEIALALEAIARRGMEDRLALEKKLHGATVSKSRWARILAAAKAIGAGSALAALAVVARALIAHGDAAAMARLQTDRIEQLHLSVAQLKIDAANASAQAAADHSILQILAARLSAAPLSP